MFERAYYLTTVPLYNTSNVTNMDRMFYYSNVASVPLFNTSKVTSMEGMFYMDKSLSSVPLFDTSKVTNMKMMFAACDGISTIPLFDTSSVINMDSMFSYANNVESGALALYQQASTQTNPPSQHNSTFLNCGQNTTSGRAELAQIPTSWGGTME